MAGHYRSGTATVVLTSSTTGFRTNRNLAAQQDLQQLGGQRSTLRYKAHFARRLPTVRAPTRSAVSLPVHVRRSDILGTSPVRGARGAATASSSFSAKGPIRLVSVGTHWIERPRA